MEVINHRGISQNNICPVCNHETECLDHALLYCAFSSSVWNLWPENPMRLHGVRKSFLDSVFFILSHASLQDLELFFTIAWAIWSNRNRYVHEGCGLSPDQVWNLAKSNAEDFARAATWDFNQDRIHLTSWTPPPLGTHKVNVDGASSDLESFSSIGVVIRDHCGQVVAALHKPLQACFSAELTEIMALEQGVLLALELHLPRIIVESDSSNTIQAIQENATGSSYGHLIQGIIQTSTSFESCSFNHVSRNFNSVAHELAQHARRSGAQHLWKGVSPPFIVPFLQADMV